MGQNKFTHLHVHTEYSLLDGSAKISELIAETKRLGMDSIAITDHGVMFGVIDFYKEAIENGIKPILGCEVYVASGSRHKKDNSVNINYYHLVLLAENMTGYQNLVKLVSYGFTEGFYYKPRVDMELLKQYSEGLIALSACLAGPVAKTILRESYEKAKDMAFQYEEIFGKGNFFLELQDHGMEQQKLVNQNLMRMSKETGIPLVCTNDTHYIYQEDYRAHDVLLCIQTAKTINDTDRMRYEGNQFYLKSPDEMYTLFPYAKEALENTTKIAERCNLEIAFNESKLPKFDVPQNIDAFNYLKTLCEAGLQRRYKNPTAELRERLEYELNTIRDMGFTDYFLIVWDFINFAKINEIMVGPGRGSAAGSIVAYCLNITNIDPIKFNLIFERFLNPERISMPDIDIDFCYEKRQDVIDYVIEKYGDDHVAQIITFGTMAARAAIRDVGRALGVSYAEVDTVAKMIPFELGITIEKALRLNVELKKLYDENEQIKYLIDMAKRLEGLPRHASTHAAGVVICKEPVVEYVPLNSNDGVITTQFPMNTLENLGLLKMDFLGLRTLTVIQNAVKEIKVNHHVDIDIDNIDFDDEGVYNMISQGKTEGVFQLESAGMKQFMKELKPHNIEDIIAGVSLYRPGPMDFIPKYVRGKHNPDTITYTHESLKPILNTTYGCIVYQEQVMQIVRDLAGYSLGRSDLVRRAMSKKKTSVMNEERKNFVYGNGDGVPGCVQNGIPAEAAEKIFDEMIDFAKYAFNKSHAAAYAVIAYQTGWLKVYYPVEFMAALLTSVMDSSSKVEEYIHTCKTMNIEVLAPSINDGYAHFSVSDGKIRFGLSAIKNVGKNVIASLVRERTETGKFTGLTEFINRMESRDLNKRCMESFIKAGVFDCLGGKRAQYMTMYKQIMDSFGQSKKKNIEGQLNLFEIAEESQAVLKDHLVEMPEYTKHDLLEMEKEVLGIYVSGHPLSEYEEILQKSVTMFTKDLVSYDSEEVFGDKEKDIDGKIVTMGGMIIDRKVKYTRNNDAMAFITLEDLYGTIEVIVFPKIYKNFSNETDINKVVIIKGRVSASEDEEVKIICETINDIAKFQDHKSKPTLWLKISKESNISLEIINRMILNQSGNIPVRIFDEKTNTRTKENPNYQVKISDELLQNLKIMLGEECVVLKSGK